MKKNLKNGSEKQENMRLNNVNSKTQKITSLQIIYATGDFNWLKSRELKNYETFTPSNFFVCVYINTWF